MVPNILLVALFIGVLVTFHEFGHLIVAKLSRIPVEVFSIGFGPAILKRKWGGTEYRLSVVPLGGYIKMTGEDNPAAGGFNEKPLGVKAAVIASGPVSNLILGFLMLLVMYLAFGVKYVAPVLDPLPESGAARAGIKPGDAVLFAHGETIPSYDRLEEVLDRGAGQPVVMELLRDGSRLTVTYSAPVDSADLNPFVRPVVGRVRQESPAAKAGIRPGDTLLAVDGSPVTRWDEFVQKVTGRAGETALVQWRRAGVLLEDSVEIAAQTDQLTGEKIGQVGIWVELPKRNLSLPTAIWEALSRTGYVVVQTFVIIYKVATRQLTARAIGGPIMVAKIAYEGTSWGAEYFIALWALLSINLFVVNMLPVPVLDGGRILLFVIEAVRRRRLTEKELGWAANVGWVLIGAIVVFVVFNDVLRLIRK